MRAFVALSAVACAACFVDIPPLARDLQDGGARAEGGGSGGEATTSTAGQAGAEGCAIGCPSGTTLDPRDGACVVSAPQTDCSPIEITSELTIRGSLCDAQRVTGPCTGDLQRILAFRATCVPEGYSGYRFTASGGGVARMADLSCEDSSACLSSGGSVTMPLFTDAITFLPDADCAAEVVASFTLEPSQ